MLIASLIVIGVFLALTVFRIGAARRMALLRRWPAAVLALAAGFSLMRGQFWLAAGLAGLALITLALPPSQLHTSGGPARPAPRIDPKDLEARAVLGVGANATAEEIRAAHRAKMSSAHPDRGGAHADAARLNAARDRLLRR